MAKQVYESPAETELLSAEVSCPLVAGRRYAGDPPSAHGGDEGTANANGQVRGEERPCPFHRTALRDLVSHGVDEDRTGRRTALPLDHRRIVSERSEGVNSQ